MSAQKQEKFPVQEIAIRSIKADLENVQTRAEMSIDHERKFCEMIRDGERLAPVVAFWDGKSYWLADGFHRFGATKKAGLDSIRAEVRQGSRRDAMIFSAGSNLQVCLNRTADDKRRCVKMLLADKEWFDKADSTISLYCKVSPGLVSACRADYCKDSGTPFPETVIRSDGSIAPRRLGKPGISETNNGDGPTRFFLRGKHGSPRYLGNDEEKARLRAEKIRLDHLKAMADRQKGLLVSNLVYRLNRSGIAASPISARNHPGTSITGISGHLWVATSCRFDSHDAFAASIGRVLWLRAKEYGGLEDLRAVILCYKEEGPTDLFATAESLGIEFLSPDEFIESLKGKP